MKISKITLFVVTLLFVGVSHLQANSEHNKQHHTESSSVKHVGSNCNSRPWDPSCR